MSSAPADSPLPRIGHHLNGSPREGASGRFGKVYCPATGEVSAEVAFASKAEVDEAVAAAQAAFPDWAATPPHVRARVMFRLRDLIEQNADKLAELINR